MEQKSTVIIDTASNLIITLYPGQDIFDRITEEIGTPRVGDEFQLATQILPGKVDKRAVSGSDNQTDDCFRPDWSQVRHEVIETWRWGGKKRGWQQV